MIDFSKFSWTANYRNIRMIVAVIPVDLILMTTIFLGCLKWFEYDISWWIVFLPIIISLVYPFIKAVLIGLFFGVIEGWYNSRYRRP